MLNKRFNFPMIYLKNKLYVFGGREYGPNDVSI